MSIFITSRIAPAVPTLMKVSAPSSLNSSTAIAFKEQPIPVEVTESFSPTLLR